MDAPQNRVAVVTGAGRGIGRGISHRLADDGFHVALMDLDGGNTRVVAEEIGGGRASAYQVDGLFADEGVVVG